MRHSNDDAVLAAATALFREKGFDRVTLDELARAAGVETRTLSERFGSKDALFVGALVYYRRVVVERRIARYLLPWKGLAGLRAFFDTAHRHAQAPDLGCLLTNTALELTHVSPVAAAEVRSGLARIQAALRDQLEACVARGELAPGGDLETAARVLATLYQGTLVLIRAGAAADLDGVVESTLALYAPEPSRDEAGARRE